jgi:hypothetical protein
VQERKTSRVCVCVCVCVYDYLQESVSNVKNTLLDIELDLRFVVEYIGRKQDKKNEK